MQTVALLQMYKLEVFFKGNVIFSAVFHLPVLLFGSEKCKILISKT